MANVELVMPQQVEVNDELVVVFENGVVVVAFVATDVVKLVDDVVVVVAEIYYVSFVVVDYVVLVFDVVVFVAAAAVVVVGVVAAAAAAVDVVVVVVAVVVCAVGFVAVAVVVAAAAAVVAAAVAAVGDVAFVDGEPSSSIAVEHCVIDLEEHRYYHLCGVYVNAADDFVDLALFLMQCEHFAERQLLHLCTMVLGREHMKWTDVVTIARAFVATSVVDKNIYLC